MCRFDCDEGLYFSGSKTKNVRLQCDSTFRLFTQWSNLNGLSSPTRWPILVVLTVLSALDCDSTSDARTALSECHRNNRPNNYADHQNDLHAHESRLWLGSRFFSRCERWILKRVCRRWWGCTLFGESPLSSGTLFHWLHYTCY